MTVLNTQFPKQTSEMLRDYLSHLPGQGTIEARYSFLGLQRPYLRVEYSDRRILP